MSDLADFGMLLGFSPEWYAIGIVDRDFLDRARAEWEKSDDHNTEHYRYRAFKEFLAARRPLSSELAAELFQLGANDPDKGMGGAIQAAIVGLPECPPGVRTQALVSGIRSLAKLAARLEMLRELDAGLTADLFERCMACRDGAVHRRLVQQVSLSRSQVERAAEAGANRAVRNLARARLRARQYLAEPDAQP